MEFIKGITQTLIKTLGIFTQQIVNEELKPAHQIEMAIKTGILFSIIATIFTRTTMVGIAIFGGSILYVVNILKMAGIDTPEEGIEMVEEVLREFLSRDDVDDEDEDEDSNGYRRHSGSSDTYEEQTKEEPNGEFDLDEEYEDNTEDYKDEDNESEEDFNFGFDVNLENEFLKKDTSIITKTEESEEYYEEEDDEDGYYEDEEQVETTDNGLFSPDANGGGLFAGMDDGNERNDLIDKDI